MCNGKKNRGFTLVEILIVVIILGILAAIVIPQFSNASADARLTNLRTTLANVRSQIEVFKTQHNEAAPGDTVLWTVMLTQTNTTEANSATPTGGKWGPYLQSWPTNPWNNMTAATSAATDTNAGWYYGPVGVGYTFFARNADGSINQSY